MGEKSGHDEKRFECMPVNVLMTSFDHLARPAAPDHSTDRDPHKIIGKVHSFAPGAS